MKPPRLSRGEADALFSDYTPGNRERLITTFLPAARAVARKFAATFRDADIDEAHGEAYLALVLAADAYRPGGASGFHHYLRRTVWENLKRYHRQSAGPIPVNKYAAGILMAVDAVRHRLHLAGLPCGDGDALAVLGKSWGAERVESARSLLYATRARWHGSRSMLPAGDRSRPGAMAGVLDSIPCRPESAPAEAPAPAQKEAARLLSVLRPVARDVVARRFGVGVPEESAREIAERDGRPLNSVTSALAYSFGKLRREGRAA